MRIGAPRPSERATQEFVADLVERLKLLPEVQRVLVETNGGVPRVWTVIEAKPWEFSQRHPVYDAELQAMKAHPEVEADFRLINTAERPGALPDELLPSDGTLLYRR